MLFGFNSLNGSSYFGNAALFLYPTRALLEIGRNYLKSALLRIHYLRIRVRRQCPAVALIEYLQTVHFVGRESSERNKEKWR